VATAANASADSRLSTKPSADRIRQTFTPHDRHPGRRGSPIQGIRSRTVGARKQPPAQKQRRARMSAEREEVRRTKNPARCWQHPTEDLDFELRRKSSTLPAGLDRNNDPRVGGGRPNYVVRAPLHQAAVCDRSVRPDLSGHADSRHGPSRNAPRSVCCPPRKRLMFVPAPHKDHRRPSFTSSALPRGTSAGRTSVLSQPLTFTAATIKAPPPPPPAVVTAPRPPTIRVSWRHATTRARPATCGGDKPGVWDVNDGNSQCMSRLLHCLPQRRHILMHNPTTKWSVRGGHMPPASYHCGAGLLC